MTVTRLLFFAGLVIVAAVLAPRIAPDFVAGIAGSPDLVAAPGELAESPSTDAVKKILPDPGARRVSLGADPRGHFLAEARINGRPVEVMVDTGASIVALNAETARRLGISPPKSAYNASIRTANGVVDVAPVVLSEIRLGTVTVRDVQAAVIPGDVLEINLLGMSFLGRLSRFEIDGGELVLTQ